MNMGRQSSGDNEDELQLSPSETFAHNTAMRVSGAAHDSTHKTQRALASIVLGFELFVVFLTGMTIFGLSLIEPREFGIWIGLAICAVILVALGCMRIGNLGIVLGWVVQALVLLTAFILPMSLIAGGVFAALWIYCMVKGSRIDSDRIKWMSSSGSADSA